MVVTGPKISPQFPWPRQPPPTWRYPFEPVGITTLIPAEGRLSNKKTGQKSELSYHTQLETGTRFKRFQPKKNTLSTPIFKTKNDQHSNLPIEIPKPSPNKKSRRL